MPIWHVAAGVSRMTKVVAKKKIFIKEDGGPGPMHKNEYRYLAAEPGDTGVIIGEEDGKPLVAFCKSKLVAVIADKNSCLYEA